MSPSNDRLRKARIAAGFGSARQAAMRYGWIPSTYASHENGQTPVPTDAAYKYAKAFKVSPIWILHGVMPTSGSAVPSPPSKTRVEHRGMSSASEASVSVKLPIALLERIERWAEADGKKRGDIIRELIEEAIRTRGGR